MQPARHAAPEDAPLRAPPRAARRTSTSRPRSRSPAWSGCSPTRTCRPTGTRSCALIGVEPNDEPVLPEDRVLYKGEQIVRGGRHERGRPRSRAPPRSRSPTRTCPAVFDVEEALAEGAPAIKPHGTNYFVYEGHHCRRIRFGDVDAGFADGRPRLRVALPVLADRARADRDDGLHRHPAARRPAADPLRHAGVLLHARQHRADPGRAVQQAAGGGRHRRRRLRRQGRRDRRADRLHRGDGHEQAGQVRLRPRRRRCRSPRRARPSGSTSRTA